MSSKNPYTYQHNFDITNITTDPFALGTLSVGFVSWIIFIGGCAASSDTKFNFPRFSWWSIAFEFSLIVVLFLFYCYDLIDSYRNFLSASFAVAFIYSTNSANNLVYSSGSALAAASSGVILISMINMIWLIYYGGDNDSPINRWIDGFSLNRKHMTTAAQLSRAKSTRLSALASNNGGYDTLISHPISNSFSNRGSIAGGENPFGATTSNINKYSDYDNQTQANTQMNSLSRMNSHYSQKFSTSNTASNSNLSDFHQQGNNNPETGFSEPNSNIDTTSFNTNQYSNGDGANSNGAFDQDIYPYRARALYAYEANPDDVNEISFEKGEILMISEIQGRWWQAKRENGEIGICPSNYVELM
ncbi:osmosensor [Saccharomycopsis crataegensis]|uniref:High osmolarity signaling protein SHO1 n=1 Tax=Saccharomycopsis crataegensis TaxID=43959 RepID=A0AAV5QQ10_9ASCO|nr:osmosensor [Saccharomycopsis crataegensis]